MPTAGMEKGAKKCILYRVNEEIPTIPPAIESHDGG